MADGRLPLKQVGILGFMDALDWLITNLPMATAGVEYSHALQNNVKQIIIKSRTKANIRIAFISGETASNYVTLWKGTVLTLTSLDLTGKVIYFNSDVNSTIMEITELL